MGKTVSLKRAQQLLNFSIADDFSVTGALRFFGALPKPLVYQANRVYFKSLDGEWFIWFYIHPTRQRLMVAESSTGAKIDLYFYNPSFEYAVRKANTAGRKRKMKNGGFVSWGKHVIDAWNILERDFSDHGIVFTEDSMRKILDETIKRRVY